MENLFKFQEVFYRYAVAQVTGTAMISPTAIGSIPITVTFDSPLDNIIVHRILLEMEFQDSSTGINYDISNKAKFVIPDARINNLDSKPAGTSQIFRNDSNYGGSLRLSLNLGGINQLQPIAIIYGGDIVTETGQTPALGDTIFGNFTIEYSTGF